MRFADQQVTAMATLLRLTITRCIRESSRTVRIVSEMKTFTWWWGVVIAQSSWIQYYSSQGSAAWSDPSGLILRVLWKLMTNKNVTSFQRSVLWRIECQKFRVWQKCNYPALTFAPLDSISHDWTTTNYNIMISFGGSCVSALRERELTAGLIVMSCPDFRDELELVEGRSTPLMQPYACSRDYTIFIFHEIKNSESQHCHGRANKPSVMRRTADDSTSTLLSWSMGTHGTWCCASFARCAASGKGVTTTDWPLSVHSFQKPLVELFRGTHNIRYSWIHRCISEIWIFYGYIAGFIKFL